MNYEWEEKSVAESPPILLSVLHAESALTHRANESLIEPAADALLVENMATGKYFNGTVVRVQTDGAVVGGLWRQSLPFPLWLGTGRAGSCIRLTSLLFFTGFCPLPESQIRGQQSCSDQRKTGDGSDGGVHVPAVDHVLRTEGDRQQSVM